MYRSAIIFSIKELFLLIAHISQEEININLALQGNPVSSSLELLSFSGSLGKSKAFSPSTLLLPFPHQPSFSLLPGAYLIVRKNF